MKLTVLGSGTLFLTKKRFPSSFLLEVENKKILLDCGFGIIARLAEIGIDHRDIDLIFISHFHTDHFGDAFNLVHSRWVGDIYDKLEDKNLIYIGPKTIEERFRKWREIFWPEPKESHPVEFYEGKVKHKFNEIELRTFPIIHVPWFDSIGIQLFAENKKIVYPGDVGSSHDFNDLIRKSQNADLLIIESGYPHQTPNHFSCEQIKELVKKAEVKQVLVVHNQHIQSEEERIKEFISKNPKFKLAEDKMVLDF